MAKDVPLVVDADGITLLAHHDELRAAIHGRPVVLTPHAGEFARIAGEVGADRIAAARRAAAELGVTVLLKGNATVVADPDGRALVHPSTGVVGGDRGLGRRPDRHLRRAARRRAGAVVGGRVRGVRARPGGRPRRRRRRPPPPPASRPTSRTALRSTSGRSRSRRG